MAIDARVEKIVCPSCQKSLNVPPGPTGRKAKCGRCGTPITLPATDESMTPQAPQQHFHTANVESPSHKSPREMRYLGIGVGVLVALLLVSFIWIEFVNAPSSSPPYVAVVRPPEPSLISDDEQIREVA